MHALLAWSLLASIDLGAAQHANAELQAICDRDRGRMWGRSVCGPLVFAEHGSREAVQFEGGMATPARVPDSIGIANTAVQWDGKRWTMVVWPLPKGTIARRALLAHESFHGVQNVLGLPMASPANAHLDGAEARYWMRMEWRALARALATREDAAIADALTFRARRRALTAGAADEERALEMNEGLAEYTGYALAVPNERERVASLLQKLATAEKSETYARSFAYASGPAWGTLLERRDPRWTRRVKATDDFGKLIRVTPNAIARTSEYGGDAVLAEETARATQKRALMARLQATFVDGPVLTIPLVNMQFTFDPNHVQPFGERGSVYETLEVRDAWGKIVVTKGGALITSDFQKLIVPAGGEGYELTLNDGWVVVDGVREGDRRVRESRPSP